jgi:hypothetical protein
MKRSLIFGLIAVLSAGLLLAGCSQSTDGNSSSIVVGGWLVDYVVTGADIPTAEADLNAALLNPAYTVIGVKHSIGGDGLELAGRVEIPAGTTVVLFSAVVPDELGIEIKGTLVVEGAGVLTLTSDKSINVADGRLEIQNGTLKIDSVTNTLGQLFDPSKIAIRSGTLAVTDTPLATLDLVKSVFRLVPKGDVILKGISENVKPSALAAAFLTETTAVRRLSITDPVPFAAPGDLVEELTIPVGLTFTTADPLPSLTSLTVLGDLTATAATLANIETLTVAGSFSAASATYFALTELTVSSEFDAGTGLGTLKTLTVAAGGDFTAPSVGGAEGVTVTVEKDGSADITTITKLVEGTIAGTLTAESFTPFDTTANAATPLSALAGAVINTIPFTGESTKVKALAAATVTTEDFKVPATASLIIPAAGTLIIGAGSTFTYDGQVTIAATGSLVLATAAQTNVAKIAGKGTITAGFTAITGSWNATANADPGTLTILSAAAGATITADGLAATGLEAGAAGATITQGVGSTNTLTIDEATIIGLGGDGVAVGSIILKGAASDPGKIVLTKTDTSIISTGATSAAITVTDTVTLTGATLTTTSWKSTVATEVPNGKWSSVSVSADDGAIVPSGTADVTLSGASTISSTT